MQLEMKINENCQVNLGDVLISKTGSYIIVLDSYDNYLLADLDGGESYACYLSLAELNENIKGLIKKGLISHYSASKYKLKLEEI